MRAGIWVVLMAGIGGGLCYGVGRRLGDLTSRSWPGVLLALALMGGAFVAFWVASTQLEGWLSRWPNGAGALHWFSIAALGIALMGGLGIPVAAAGPRDLGYVLAEDAGMALLVGALLALAGPVAGVLVYRLLRRFHKRRADAWAPPEDPSRRFWALFLRCLLVGFLGLFLSVGEQAVALVSGGAASSNVANVYAPIGGWVLGSAMAWKLTTPLFPVPSHHPSRHVIHASALSLIFSVLFVFLLANEAADASTRKLWSKKSGRQLAEPLRAQIPMRRGKMDYMALAARFSPELRFQGGERWYPTSVSWFLKHARAAVDRQGCVSTCYELSCDDTRGACAESGLGQPTIYVRILRGGRWPGKQIPNILQGGFLLLQYWFFYNYDSIEMPVIKQWHQGDWEQVSVALSVEKKRVRPRFVGYSEHCAGALLPWSLVELGRGSTHPLVFVARGSHANYPRLVDAPVRQLNCSLNLVPPRYLGVADLFFSSVAHGADIEVPVAYTLSIRDRTGDEAKGGFKLRVLKPGDEIESFHGFWGKDNNLEVWFGGAHKAGQGPRSPSGQASWIDPGGSMFCSGSWFRPAEPTCTTLLPPVREVR